MHKINLKKIKRRKIFSPAKTSEENNQNLFFHRAKIKIHIAKLCGSTRITIIIKNTKKRKKKSSQVGEEKKNR